jgi:hypothetical protein
MLLLYSQIISPDLKPVTPSDRDTHVGYKKQYLRRGRKLWYDKESWCHCMPALGAERTARVARSGLKERKEKGWQTQLEW